MNRRPTIKRELKSFVGVAAVALGMIIYGFLQNRYGQFSDVRGFFGMRFMDNKHQWPYSTYVPLGASNELHAIEYPALTGLVVWALTFLSPFSGDPIMNYFHVNVIINGILYLVISFVIFRLAGKKLAYLLVLAPAVAISLNLNWDLWVVLPMIVAIYFFEKQKFDLSAFALAIAIATKFFPVVLLLPVTINLLREKKFSRCLRFNLLTLLTWFLINIPFIVTFPSGWLYFYKFSFERGLGEGSFYTIFKKFGFDFTFPESSYYIFNIGIFVLLIFYLVRSKRNIPITESSFLTILAFTLFGKQYSMQYVIWLTPLATLAMLHLRGKKLSSLIPFYALWQLSEFLFNKAYFSNLYSRILKERGLQDLSPFTDNQYAIVASFRYLLVMVFALMLVRNLQSLKVRNQKDPTILRKSGF
jgi:uncharacterized membrane protein